MKNRQQYNLKIPLFLWNMLLSVLSGIGAFHILPWLFNNILERGILSNVCDHQIAYTSYIGWYISIFNLTKCVEWIDTLFLVLRKRSQLVMFSKLVKKKIN
jgi:elongation of very long chain fatty acids protein 6